MERSGDIFHEIQDAKDQQNGSRSVSRSRSRSRDRGGGREYHSQRERLTESQSTATESSEGHNLYTTEDSLREIFSKYGQVLSVSVVREPLTQKSRGFGFVSFRDLAEAERAIAEVSGLDLDGRNFKVEKARRNTGYQKTPGRYLGPPQLSVKYAADGSSRRGDDRGGRDRDRERERERDRYDSYRGRERDTDRGYDRRAERSREDGVLRRSGYGEYDRPYDRPPYDDLGAGRSTLDYRHRLEREGDARYERSDVRYSRGETRGTYVLATDPYYAPSAARPGYIPAAGGGGGAYRHPGDLEIGSYLDSRHAVVADISARHHLPMPSSHLPPPPPCSTAYLPTSHPYPSHARTYDVYESDAPLPLPGSVGYHPYDVRSSRAVQSSVPDLDRAAPGAFADSRRNPSLAGDFRAVGGPVAGGSAGRIRGDLGDFDSRSARLGGGY